MNALRLLLVLGLVFAPFTRINAQSKTSDALKRSGLLPEADSKPPTISKQEGELVEAGIIVWQTDRGRQAPAPTPDKPIYYVAYDGGFGSTISGVKPPPPGALGRTLRAALSSAGYEPATGENRPAVAIVYRLQFGWPDSMTTEVVRDGCEVTISAYDYQDLTRSEMTPLWVAQCRHFKLPTRQNVGESLLVRNPEEAFLAFVAACGPYLGALLPGDVPRKIEIDWVAVPRRADLTDRTP
ncbi:MAG: hypothetical protein ABIZ49_12620, partial [Opitutaceae bacterium]